MSSFFKKSLILHPYLFGIYFALTGFALIVSYVSLFEMLIAILIILLSVFGLELIIIFITKDKLKSGIISSIILIPLLFYLRFCDFINNNFPTIGRNRYVLAILSILSVIFIYLVFKTKKNLSPLNSYLNMLATSLIIYGIILLMVNIKSIDSSLELKLQNQLHDSEYITSANINNLPDIYFIILDAYTSPNSLKKYFGYDDTDFIDSLRKKGFYIAEDSKAFDMDTVPSMASSLNMSNDKELLIRPGKIVSNLIKNCTVVTYLRSKSYDIINLSPFDLLNSPRFYTAFLSGIETPFNFHGIFYRTAISQFIMHLQMSRSYKINLDILYRLKEMPHTKQNKPRFIYAHLMMPHCPYCFDRNGNIIPWLNRKRIYDKKGYLEQLIFTNKMVFDLVDSILTNSPKQPIIIIQGDHGFRHLDNNVDKEIESRTILNAYYLPNDGNKLPYPYISPFNTFRVILDYYFGTKHELLKES